MHRSMFLGCLTVAASLASTVGSLSAEDRERAEYKPGEVITNSIGMKLAYIPAGEFLMGSPESEKERFEIEKQHRVKITKSFYLGVYDVTRGQFAQFVADADYKTDDKRSWKNPGFTQADDHPVVNVNWNDVQAYCVWLSKKEGKKYRLPTEAEWEYACRAGTTTAFNFGDRFNGDNANCDGTHPYGTTVKGAYLQWTTSVDSYKPNAFGLYDMHGNAWQWCEDWYDKDYYADSPSDDPPGPAAGSFRVLRGGGWSCYAVFCRSANRYRGEPTDRHFNAGFRVVVER